MTRLRTAALVGNPNAGKSALFNALTGARQKIANYPGVTVERVAGVLALPDATQAEVIDLPGAYAFDASSPDEEVTRQVGLGEFPGEARPEVLILVLDAANLEQHLVFAQEVIAARRKKEAAAKAALDEMKEKLEQEKASSAAFSAAEKEALQKLEAAETDRDAAIARAGKAEAARETLEKELKMEKS